jgi:hypothetical protein
VFNVFNTKNGGYGEACCGPSAFPDDPNILVGPPRSLQLGTAFRF